MFLQRLNEYADRLDLPPSMYRRTRVPWVIPLDRQGKFLGQVLSTSSGRERGKDPGKEFVVPHIGTRTVNADPALLVDKASYVLGLSKPNPDDRERARTEVEHRRFVRLLQEAHRITGVPELRAVVRFYDTYDRQSFPIPNGMRSDDFVGFLVDGKMPTDLPEVQSFWAELAGRTGAEGPDPRPMTCLVCGRQRFAVDTFPVPIRRRVPGTDQSVAIVSVNMDVFESYGLKDARVSPVCHQCAERVGLALEALLRNPATHYVPGEDASVVYVFWTRSDTEFSVATFLMDPKPDEVKALLESATRGKAPQAIEDEAFYAAVLSGSGGRLVVRDWLETTIPAVRSNLARYFAMQQLEGRGPFSVAALARSLVPKKRSTQRVRGGRQAVVEAALLNCALKGGALPDWILAKAVRRNGRGSGGTHEGLRQSPVSAPRAALMKMVLLSKLARPLRGDEMVSLDLDNRDPAYLCGRLLAILEAAQRFAIPAINQTVADRYYGTASCAPRAVFPRLLRGVQAHLGKLRRERPALHVYLSKQLEGVMALLHEFPTVLNLQEQAHFGLGYYHQRAYRVASVPSEVSGENEEELEQEGTTDDE